jgi:Rod binding domain-containing protein
MDALSPPALPAQPLPSADAARAAKTRAQIEKTAKDFEAAFIGQMLNHMFEGVDAPAPFGGGHGEDAFKSFLTEAVAKQMAANGGVGLADDLRRQMLQLQGLE